MNQSIRYRGMSLAKDEQAVQAGELSLCGGVELHDGALRPSLLSGTKLAKALDTGSQWNTVHICTLRYVHETTAYKHYIGEYIATSTTDSTVDVHELYWYKDDGTCMGRIKQFDNAVKIKSIDSIGNTLIVIATDGIHYILWKNVTTTYKYLGQKPPFLPIKFGLSANKNGDYETGGIDIDGSTDGFYEAFQVTTSSCGDALSVISKSGTYTAGETCINVKSTQQSTITDNIWGLINRTNNYISKAGHFYANFYVRYCYRLYDGSMVMHSAPIFMPVLVPNSYKVYVVNAHTSDSDTAVNLDDTINVKRKDSAGNELSFKISKLTFMYDPRNVALTYAIANAAIVTSLKEWSDIVKSVDVFVSEPVTNADSSALMKTCSIISDDYANAVGVWSDIWEYNSTDPVKITVDIPSLSNESFSDKIANTSTFFNIYSFKIDDLASCSEKELPADKSSILNITTQEQMKDDYKTHNFLFPEGSYVYNHRLNVFGAYETLFDGFDTTQMFPLSPWLQYTNSFSIDKIVVVLNTDDGYKYVDIAASSSNLMVCDEYVLYNMPKFYPDSRAEKMIFFGRERVFGNDASTGQYKVLQFDLEACNELNGAIHVGEFGSYTPTLLGTAETAFVYTVDKVVTMQNKIYTSEVNNPYYFPLDGINTVGIGTINGLASTTRALSQGQFGQYPLMAFSSDGIWALQVSSTGTYSSIHPISREVCINASSIAQIDQSVVFSTDRALNKVMESSVSSISDILDGPFFDIKGKLAKLATFFTGTDEEYTIINKLIDFSTPPIEYFKNGKVLYDFVNNRLICLPDASTEDKEIAIVYSIRDDTWSTMLISTPLTVLNSYPYPYIQDKNGIITILDKKYDYTDTTTYPGIVVTRTLSFQGVMIAINGFEQMENSTHNGVLFIFGSNDNRTWHYVGRSAKAHANYLPAHSFRFFRLALYLQLAPGEQYMQTDLNIIEKFKKL